MASNNAQQYQGPYTFDLTGLTGILIDLVSGTGYQREQEGFAKVEEELSKSVPAYGAAVGISPDVYTRFTECTDRLAKIRAVKGQILKLAEVLEESELAYEDQRETELGMIVDAIRSAARRKDESVLAPFAETLAYKNRAAMKGVKTRRKNAEEKSKSEPAAPPPAEPTPR